MDQLQKQEENGEQITVEALLERMIWIKETAVHARTKVFTKGNEKELAEIAAEQGKPAPRFAGTGSNMKGREDVAKFAIRYLKKIVKQTVS